MSSADLKPCPFCGGPAKAPTHYNGTLETGCAGDHECPGTDVMAPISAWNRRPQPSPSSAEKISDERLAEIAAEYGSMADGLPPQLEDAPGAASAFYMSCSLGEVAAMATELATRRAQSAVVGEALQAARDAFKVEYDEEGKVMSVGYDSGALRPLIALLDAALNATQEGK